MDFGQDLEEFKEVKKGAKANNCLKAINEEISDYGLARLPENTEINSNFKMGDKKNSADCMGAKNKFYQTFTIEFPNMIKKH